MTVPSVIGLGFQSAVDDLQRLLDTRQLTREELEEQLTPDDLIIVESKIVPTSWIPVDTYRRVVDILVSIEAQGDPEGYLFQRGWRAAERLHKAGLYSQFDASAEKWGLRVGKLIVTLGHDLWNFTKWEFELLGLPVWGFRVIVSEAEHLPEVARFTTHGFMEYLARSATGLTLRVTSERFPGGRIVFTGNRA
ncbi:MAG TPA: hypothetical protein VEG67_01685 [Myxococcota bacterium]|nr:hypothetical protein [Myxococcota bacterium]